MLRLNPTDRSLCYRARFQRYLSGIGVLFFWGILLLSLEAHEQPWQPLVQQLQKSPHDPRDYQAIRLDNGMKVLLVSDAKAPYSMTTVALPVGSLHDPQQHPGLVHYLEHLLFLGSEHYPEGIEIQNHNAGTGSDRTIFMASTQHPWLAVTLERLADALANPNFDPQLAEKERHSVHQEALGHRTEDGWRIFQINKETLNPKHPFARFSTGNLETLADKPTSALQQAVQRFHQQYYSANIMVAVIYSNQPLAALAHLAVESYGRIPNHQTVVKAMRTPLATSKEQGVAIHYVPAKIYHALQVDFVISRDAQDDLHSKTNAYLDSLISDSGPGTLADWLQQQGLANKISVGYNPTLAGNAGLFSIYIDPTEAGMAQQDLIIAALFRYLQLISNQGIQRCYFEQLSQRRAMHFQQIAGERHLGYVTALTDNLLNYPADQVLQAGFLADHYRPALIQRRLAKMTAANARIWLTSPQAAHDKTAYFLEAPYQIKPLNSQQLAEWQRLGQTLTFQLPPLNPYLPTDFSLNPRQPSSPKPQQVFQEKGIRAWLMPSTHFAEQPKVDLTVILRQPVEQLSTPRNQMLFKLLMYLLDSNLTTFFQQASAAGVHIAVNGERDIEIHAQGFRQKLPMLLEKLMLEVQSVRFDEKQLTQAKYRFGQSLDSLSKQAAYEQANRIIMALNCRNYSEIAQRRALLASITLEEVIAYRHQLFNHHGILDLLAVGDFSQLQLRQLATALQKHLKSTQQPLLHPPLLVIDKPQKACFNQCTRVDGNALSAFYIPLGYDRLSSQANTYLLSNLLSTWFFDQLRTQEQLGYTVYVSTATLGQQYGLAFTVQSAAHTPAQLYQRYQVFYQQAWKQLQKLKEKREFAAYQRGLLKQLQMKPSSLSDEAAPWRHDFLEKRLSFDSQAALIARVKRLTAEEVLRFYQQAIIAPTGLALLSQVQGSAAASKAAPSAKGFAAPAGWKVYPTATALQQQLLAAKTAAPSQPAKG